MIQLEKKIYKKLFNIALKIEMSLPFWDTLFLSQIDHIFWGGGSHKDLNKKRMHSGVNPRGNIP